MQDDVGCETYRSTTLNAIYGPRGSPIQHACSLAPYLNWGPFPGLSYSATGYPLKGPAPVSRCPEGGRTTH